MTVLKFIGKELPGRNRSDEASIESVMTQIKERPGEWAEIKRTPITSRHFHIVKTFQKRGAEAKTRQDKATSEIVYYVRWPANGSQP